MVDQGTSAAAGQSKASEAHARTFTVPPADIDAPASGHQLSGAPGTAEFSQRQPIAPPAAASARTADSARIPPAAESAKVPPAANALGSSGGSPDDQAQRDNKGFKAAMAKIRSALQHLSETAAQPERREALEDLIAQVDTQMDDADELLRAGPGQPPDRAFRLAAGQTTLTGDVEDAQQEAEDEQESEAGKESTWDKIKGWLKQAGRKLWDMISRLTTVKEWSLTGTAGGSVLGLAQASISVTFGPSPG